MHLLSKNLGYDSAAQTQPTFTCENTLLQHPVLQLGAKGSTPSTDSPRVCVFTLKRLKIPDNDRYIQYIHTKVTFLFVLLLLDTVISQCNVQNIWNSYSQG